MQKACTRKTRVNESRLHARKNSGDPAHNDIAYKATLRRALHFNFLHNPLNEPYGTGLKGLGLQKDFFATGCEHGLVLYL
jgi:hypothetical protein